MVEGYLANQYQETINQITQLAQYDRYEGAFVFGSFVTGHLHPASDLDVSVVVTDEPICPNVSHPLLNGIRVDISFDSMPKLAKMMEETMNQGLRKPWLYDAVILFDKKGRLQQLRKKVLQEAKPLAGKPLDTDHIQFEMYYKYTKPRKYLRTAPETANLIMHMQLAEVLKFHYKFQRQWWVSDKSIFENLAEWDPAMGKILLDFVNEHEIEQKYRLWTKMIDYILLPIGGRNFDQFEESCDCDLCQVDIQRLLALFA